MYGGSAGLAVTCLSTVMAEGEVISTQEPEEPPFPVVRGPFGSLGSPVQLVPPPPPPPPPDFLGSMELVPSRLPTESSPAWADQLSGASQSEDMTANHNISELLGATHIQPTGTAPSSDQGRPTISVDDHSTAITEHVSQASALALTPRSVDTPGQIGSKSHTGQRSATASSRRQSGTPEMSGSSEPRRRLQPGETYVNGQIRRTGWVVKRKDKKKRK
ncbi:hypothetical protein I316_05153 [Kwoniella heveanensis BCC8398]|uniref:Uncharacterized protein n=1 Tax=Kwoniella heveanensis BCC8398 TaxID=1296120 RepID=A0A1B9GQ37_9TREE|nr:hypothetical protein I316_05153 [Kwoniella heveanensis BCC8398]